ncbi:MAG: phosphatidate cytidylyltransferase [Jhaorihella sp.]
MSQAAGRWADLGPRLISAVVLIAVAAFAVRIGGVTFEAFVALVCAAMVWELARMLDVARPGAALALAALTAVAIFADPRLPPMLVLPVLAVPALAGLALIGRNRGLFAVFAVWIALAGHGFIWVRGDLGIAGMAWLICVVVATDVAGYFAGKAIGGPKFWPRVSPKKTWSGTAAGWVAAALVAGGFVLWAGAGPWLIALSVAMSFASQAGDVAESAIKRKSGVKDASRLIPGHGGFLDRFDGMMGAALFLALAGQVPGLLPEFV